MIFQGVLGNLGLDLIHPPQVMCGPNLGVEARHFRKRRPQSVLRDAAVEAPRAQERGVQHVRPVRRRNHLMTGEIRSCSSMETLQTMCSALS